MIWPGPSLAGTSGLEALMHAGVAAADQGAPDGPRPIDDALGEHGSGLQIAAALATQTGVCGNHGQRVMWAVIPWDYVPAHTSWSQDPYDLAIAQGHAERLAVSPGDRPDSVAPPCDGGRSPGGPEWCPQDRPPTCC